MQTVNIDPVSEAAVRILSERMVNSDGTVLANFTAQEIDDLVAGIDLVTTIKRSAAGIDLEATVAAIKEAAAADAGLMAFIASAAEAGQTTEGPGDIGNFFPMTKGNIWRFQGTVSKNDGPRIGSTNTSMITGTKVIGGVTATVFTETSPQNALGETGEYYLFKDSRGITYRGNNDTSDLLTSQLVSYPQMRFPLRLNATMEPLNKTGLDYGKDLDGDGVSEKVDVSSLVTVAGFEGVVVPARAFPNSVRIVTTTMLTFTMSKDNTKATTSETLIQWFAAGIGPVGRIALRIDEDGSVDIVTEKLTRFIHDTTPPVNPSVDAATLFANVSSQNLCSIKEPDSSIWINGVLAVALNVDTTWCVPVTVTVEGATTFCITSKDAAGNESGTVTATIILDITPPTSPVFTATVNPDRTVTINWDAATDSNGILEYRIRRGIIPIARTTETSFTDIEVEPGSIADYYVRAVDNAGNLSDLPARQTVRIPSGGTGVFSPPVLGALPMRAGKVAVADVNGDGIRDLVVSGGDSGTQINTALSPITGSMAFTTSSASISTFSQSTDNNLPSFFLTNIMGDRRPELLGDFTTLAWDTQISNWVSIPENKILPNTKTVAFLDINNDEILDIISETGFLSGYLGKGDGAYQSSGIELTGIQDFDWGRISLIITGGRLGPITAADFDRNGLADLVVWDHDILRVVRQTDPGVFAVTAGLSVIDHRFFRTALLIADVTGDGYPDIVYPHYASDPDELRVYVNDGTGGFPATPVSSGILRPWNFSAGDINGDGIPDLAVGNRLSNGRVVNSVEVGHNLDLYISRGDGTFTFIRSIDSEGVPFLVLADIDRDGDVDLITAGGVFQSPDVKVYLDQ